MFLVKMINFKSLASRYNTLMIYVCCIFVCIGCGLAVEGGSVAVCRDAAGGRCHRTACRYYHIPVPLPPAPPLP